jgi:hypothetical protein
LVELHIEVKRADLGIVPAFVANQQEGTLTLSDDQQRFLKAGIKGCEEGDIGAVFTVCIDHDDIYVAGFCTRTQSL